MPKWIEVVAVAMAGAVTISPAMAQDGAGQQAGPCVENFDPAADYFPQKVQSDHSRFWEASYHGNYKVLTVADTENLESGDSINYVLVQCGTPAPELSGALEGAVVIEVPIERTIVTHRNAIAMINELDRLSTIVGLTGNYLRFANEDAWYADVVAGAGDPADVASESDLDIETTLSLEADVIFMAGYGPGYDEVTSVTDRGLTAVMVSNRTEPTPLGSSEWLEFIAAFYNAEGEASAIFDTIEADYNAIVEQVAGALGGDMQVAYACMGEVGGCGFMYAHGANTLNGHILQLFGVTNPFAEGNDLPNGMQFDFESALGRTQETDFFIAYYYASPEALATDGRYESVPALAAGNYTISTVDNWNYCNAVNYVRVDELVRDYAIGLLPEMFPGEQGVCFQVPSQ
ncbi:ABC transporter substrate-binding protein [Pelagibacterium halotolerans]|uniref:Vitamin B12 ABC transporter, B12-binding component BtuF n=1 Tax=Pelagibacterium halotolerans (strain DSM 22347 / JCM 15775 / CGMCC 1.7692 / B2) TaxID=1082931 RepID=G4RAY7_PELHB|nr:ABC transporter substrate-binding protein [Pelagibacterium halotolerans]AEQ53623.1 Vitamin B12 ABC transporter, B12-binding component BtuF [Pelagibacterium halotolerans B2]QJR20203.1 ABC transporter substrate-binding protein [Pelagibacterium halotolerans]SEA91401.1 iron complex transport system substrate-binding protein [Pelagibacterium halotolerans]